MLNRRISQLTGNEQEGLRKSVIEILKRDGKLASIEIRKMPNRLAVRYILGDMFRHEFVRTNVLFDREDERGDDSMCYRLFMVTDKFREYVKEGKEDLIR